MSEFRTPFLKQWLMQLARRAGFLGALDSARAGLKKRDSDRSREAFRSRHGDVALPPDEVAYDPYGSFDWEHSYWNPGIDVASKLARLLAAREPNPGKLLEWGCGPARVIRHMPKLLPGWSLSGSDYNPAAIRWCREAIGGIEFSENSLLPPLPFAAARFDCIYAVSVFTHLSEEVGQLWMRELTRCLRPGGLLMITLHGAPTYSWLLPEERARYAAGHVVVRGEVAEGSRLFLSYHPEAYVRSVLLKDMRDVELISGILPQELWLARTPGG